MSHLQPCDVEALKRSVIAHREARRLVLAMMTVAVAAAVVAVWTITPILLMIVAMLLACSAWIGNHTDITAARGTTLRRLLVEAERRAAPDAVIGTERG